jgi:hypothetical protein
MAKKRYTSEEIIHKLREAGVPLGQGRSIARSCKQIGVTEQFRSDMRFTFNRLLASDQQATNQKVGSSNLSGRAISFRVHSDHMVYTLFRTHG